MKYIIVNRGGRENVYIFDQSILHAHFAHSVAAERAHITAAGFVTTDSGGGCRCLGASTSLGIGSRGEEDARKIHAAMGVAAASTEASGN
ncbi:MAG: hypothetical protein ABT940_03950 [Alphaproteobacteria bacterium]